MHSIQAVSAIWFWVLSEGAVRMCRNIKCMQCVNYLLLQWFSASSAPFCFVHSDDITARRWAHRDLKCTAAASQSPTWLRHHLQFKFDLWAPSDHCVDTGVFFGNNFYSERVLVPVGCNNVFAVAGNVLWVALPFYFSVWLFGLCLKDHRGPLFCLLSLWFPGKCWNWGGWVGN